MKQFLKKNGTDTFVRVHAILPEGIMIEVREGAFFLPYTHYPWFGNASVSDIFNVEMCGTDGIRWDALDVDLAIDSLLHPERYPLTFA
ncbi:MAG: DUF2442 domain-containing protein [Tannerella sp.]|jgi:hypothetical protein|nr:DUF2442 domain-containing protein [Tannerella sp.]